MAMCEECRANGTEGAATRIVRIDDPGSKFLRYLCKKHAKDYTDTQRPAAGRGNKYKIQRLPLSA